MVTTGMGYPFCHFYAMNDWHKILFGHNSRSCLILPGFLSCSDLSWYCNLDVSGFAFFLILILANNFLTAVLGLQKN